VRVVDREVQKGKFYNKKGTVLDVAPGGVCTVCMDGNALVEVAQRRLETVLPKAGGTVMVVAGKEAGTKAKLLEKDSKHERVVIQGLTTLEVLTVSMDNVAEWRGGHGEDED